MQVSEPSAKYMAKAVGYKKTEFGTIPDDWDFVRLGSHANFRTGPFGSALHQTDYIHDGIPIVNPMQIIDGKIIATPSMTISESSANRLVEFRLKTGDIVIGRRGEMGRCAVVTAKSNGWLCGTGSMILRLKSSLDSGFTQRILSSPPIIAAIENASVGSTMINLNQGTLSNLKIPVPPTKEEQQAIATALSDTDALIDALEQLLAKKRQIKQGAMRELLTGEKRLAGFQGEWAIKSLGDCLLNPPDYGINAPAVDFSDQLPTYIRITDITDDGKFKPNPKVSVKTHNLEQYTLKQGDILFTRTGASVGKSYLYTKKDGPLIFAGFLIRVRTKQEELLPEFLFALTKTENYWKWVTVMSMRSGQPGINGNEYKQLPIPVPSIEEQTAIAAILSDMDTDITELETRLGKVRQVKQGMMRELLTGRTRLV